MSTAADELFAYLAEQVSLDLWFEISSDAARILSGYVEGAKNYRDKRGLSQSAASAYYVDLIATLDALESLS